MASNNIKGLTIEIGGDVSKLTDALKSTDQQIKSSSSELRELDKLLKFDPNNTVLLAQKQQVLAESIDETKSRLDSLRTAQEQAEPRLQGYDAWKQKNDVLSTSIGDMEKALRRLRTQQEAVSETEGADSTQYKTLSAQIEEAEKQLKTLKKEQKEWFDECGRPVSPESYRALQREIAATERDLHDLVQQSEDTAKATEALQNAADDASDSVGDMGKSADRAGEQLDDGAKQVAEIGSASEKSGKNVKSFGDILKGSLAANIITDGLREISNGIKEIASDTITAGSDAESAMAKVATIADTSKLSIDTLQAQILDLSTKTGKSVADIAESVYSAISGGVDTADAVAVVDKATQLAAGGFTDTATAIDVLTTAINAYGLSTDDAAKLSDYLLTTQNLGKTTVDELAGSMGKVIPLASAYGVQMDNLSSAYAIMTANGIATAESTTYIKSMLNELGDSGSTVSAVLKEQTGKSFSELNAEGMSLGDVLAILGQSVDGDTGKFNELWSSSEAGIGALSILGSGTERYAEVLDAMRKSAGTTEKAYATMTNTFEHKSDELKNTLQNLEIEGFDGFKASFKGTMDAVNKELQSDKTKTAVKNLGKSIGSLTSALSSAAVKMLPKLADALSFAVNNAKELAVVVAGLVVAFNGFKIVSTLSGSIKSLVGVFSGLNAVMNANPIGAIVTAAGALIAVFGALAAAADDTTGPIYELSEAEQRVRDDAEAAKESYAEMKKSFSHDVGTIMDEAKRVEGLWEELQTLADATGNVTEANRDRVSYILGELKEATGEEWNMVDGSIQRYDELKGSVENLIKAKQAERLVEAGEDEYLAARENYTTGLEDLENRNRQIQAQQLQLAEDRKKLAEFEADNAEALRGVDYSLADLYAIEPGLALEWENLTESVRTGSDILAGLEAEYDSANSTVAEYYEDMMAYEQAQAALVAGNYDDAIALMTRDTAYKWAHLSENRKISEEERAELQKDYDHALFVAENYRKNYEAGMAGYTEDGLKEAEAAAEELGRIWSDAAEDAINCGGNISAGFASGIRNKVQDVDDAAHYVTQTALNRMRNVAQIKSPSKVTTQYGRYMDVGLALGLKDSLGDVLGAAESLIGSVLAKFSSAGKRWTYSTHA